MTATSRAHVFQTAAAQYAAGRPSYPPELLDAVEECAGRPLAGARVADVGAGTGIATALLYERGADVIAIEPGERMAAQCRRALPDVPLVLFSAKPDPRPFSPTNALVCTKPSPAGRSRRSMWSICWRRSGPESGGGR